MSKHKKNKAQKNIAQSAVAIKANGLKAFQNKDYDKAIVAWEKIPIAIRPAAALAEAHFRRGLARLYGPSPNLQAGRADLRQAVAYQPIDACYNYHRGLAAHHADDLPEAIQAYQAARQAGGEFSCRAAYPLALALLQQGKDSADDPAWAELIPSERAMLQNASAFRRRPYHLAPDAPILWQALAALDSGEIDAAQTDLQEALLLAQTAQEKGLAHYYLGLLAARNEAWDDARKEWNTAYAAGLRTHRLEDNLAGLYQRLAEQFLAEGDASTAFEAIQEAARHAPEDDSFNELLVQIHQQLGYQAASTNHWGKAQQHWRTAVELDKGSFRLAYNLALAYERDEDFIAAAQTWREALRRRPRRSDHPDALTDAQVARLWQRAAECYHQGGAHSEAGQIYQHAVKWAPENLDLRLALAESLLGDGRLVAARNELERILDRDPNHVSALLRLGEAYFRNDEEQWWIRMQAKRIWEKAFDLQPDNLQVRQAMTEWYIDQAEIDYSWERYAEAIDNYQKSLEYQPGNLKTLAFIAECYFSLGNENKGQEYANQVLASAKNLETFSAIIGILLRLGRDERAWEALLQSEARLDRIPAGFYVAMAENLLKDRRKPQAERWLQRAAEKAAPGEPVLLMIGEMAMDLDADLARQYLERAVAAEQEPGQAHLLLGILEENQGNARSSKKHLAEADRIARRTNDSELQERIDAARMMAGGPLAFMERLMNMGGPAAVEDFLSFMENEIDEDEFR
jgi:tetratricopeptide (TPR) repeat protein